MIWGDFLLRNITTVFVVQMLAAEAAFTMRFSRREHFALRVLLCAAAALGMSVLLPAVSMGLLERHGFAVVIAVFLLLFFAAVGAILLCFRCTLYDALFCGIAAYAIQNGLYQTVEILQLAAGVAGFDFSVHRAAAFAVLAAVHLLIYAGAYLLLARDGAKAHYQVNKGELVGLSCLMLVIVLRILPTAESMPVRHEIAWLFLHVLCCALSLYILFGMSENGNLKQELQTMQRMWHMKQEYYELSKEITQSINIKCHDLKYQVEALRRSSGTELDKKALRDIENAVMIYDAIAKTGNDALDTILTEKTLFCDKNRIKLTYIVDVNGLSFIKPIDIYAIFGNALDNAIESALKMPDPARRIITLSVVVSGALLIVNVKNSFEGTLTVENGLPVTSKGDPGNHGFGLKSIRLLTQKYGGEMTFSGEDGIFTLNLVIPVEK